MKHRFIKSHKALAALLLTAATIFSAIFNAASAVSFAAPESPDMEYWGKYASTYYRSQMSPEEQALYDNLYDISMEYLCSGEDIKAPYTNDRISRLLPYVSANDLTVTQAKRVLLLFVNANPQFYFIAGTRFVKKQTEEELLVSTNIYPEYVSGKNRSAATETIRQRLDGWMTLLEPIESSLEREKAVYNLVCGTLSCTDQYTDRHQSTATAILEGVSVCAGYSELFEMLLCGLGEECIVVTSPQHEWNQIKIADNWFNVDVTWDDRGDWAGLLYFNLSDKSFTKYSEAHIPYDYYEGYRPGCDMDLRYR